MLNLYYHGGSANHGCEAIVRSTVKILECPITLFSTNMDEEYKYGINEVVSVMEDRETAMQRGTWKHLLCAVDHKLFRHDYQFIKCAHEKFLGEINKNDLCLSIGGDNYCYTGVDKLGYYNKMLHKKGAKTILWGCSIEPSVLTESVIRDLKRYDLITVRESLSYEGLLQVGIKNNVMLCSDPAFQLDKIELPLPDGFTVHNTIGINISPLAANCGNLVLENYIELVRYIVEKTEWNVLLIPHVVKSENDDRITLQQLYGYFSESERVVMIEDHNCLELKGIISQCRMFIGARTHATIAAYSTCVPTLVAGYSIKAKGIAKDIFGTYENYVIPVQDFKTKEDLREAFIWLVNHEQDVKEHLVKTMPKYCKRSLEAAIAVRRLMANE